MPNSPTVPLPEPLKQKIKDALVALSLANLCFTIAWLGLLYDNDQGFFRSYPVLLPSLLALATNIFGLALLVWLVLQALRRFPNRGFHLAVHLLFFGLLFQLLNYWRVELLHISGSVTQLLKEPAGMFVVVILLIFVVWQHRLLARSAAVVVACLSPLAIYTLVKIALLCLGLVTVVRPGWRDAGQPPLRPVPAGQPRVVWIIFDELDYRLVFEQPPVGFAFSELNRLRAESLSATRANAPANKTAISMPSLMAGRRLTAGVVTSASDMSLTMFKPDNTYELETNDWSRLPNVFSDAQQLGVNTAVVGWYLPYSRLLSTNLNDCTWYPMPSYQPGRAKTYGAALIRELACLTGSWHIHQGYLDLARESIDKSVSLVTNAGYGLILLHLFPPHWPGIYDAARDRFTPWTLPQSTGYFNNVVLADHYLARIRRAMESSGEWDKTWIILSADHSWRFTDSYDQQHDFRVPFLVKPPGTNAPVAYAPEFNTVITRDLIRAILRGQISNPTNTAGWLDTHARPYPTAPGRLVTADGSLLIEK